ncbi:MAG: hypothetical protein IPI64_15545 [Chloracidobacterium sp.]|nr:hypothetical protein [Chloracidobacterium sp.]
MTFEFRNGTNKFMKVTAVKYFNRRTGKWKTETIQQNQNSISCPPRGQCVTFDGAADIPTPIGITVNFGNNTQGSDLEGANGDDITKIIFVYKTSIVSDKGFSASKESKTFVPASPKCVENKKFGFGQNWTIGGN